jgi:hypothetical protein
MTQQLRWALLGAVLGLTIAAVPSCAKKCGPDTCAGCCSSAGACVTATSATQCGVTGAVCSACADGQACTDGVCTGGTQNDGGAGVDAGPPPCHTDPDCAAQSNGTVCDVASGLCIPGVGCSDDSQCSSYDDTDRCYVYGIGCRCDLHDAPDAGAGASYAGTCRQRKAACEECTQDVECGVGAKFDWPDSIGQGVCRALAGDTSGKKYCRYQKPPGQSGACACGNIDDGNGYCVPQSGSCSSVGCNVDKDCPGGSVCSVNQPDAGANACGGVCITRCRWDFLQKDLAAPGCPSGQTCWIDSANLDATSAYFGMGRCRPACAGDADCKLSAANPFGGDNLECKGELLSSGATSDPRCRAKGECMDTLECPPAADTDIALGYCDRHTFTCKKDCRTGGDPVTGLPYTDCRPPYACAVDAGVNVCRLQNCMEQGGASVACSRGQFCCGEDKNGDGQADPCPPTAQQGPDGCYNVPTPPFCTTCMDASDCAKLTLPTWATCGNGSNSPSCSTLPMECVYAGDKNGMQGVNICAPSTFNDRTPAGMYTTREQVGCPRGYQLSVVRPSFGQGPDYCETNADCSVGTNDAGSCEADPTLRQQDGGMLKSCRCAVGSGASQCPNDPDAGIISSCRTGTSGARAMCMVSVVCVPPPGAAYLPVDQYGCGL